MLTTFPQLLLKHAAERPEAPALREKEYGIWQTHSWADLVRLVERVAAGLHLAGLKRHEHMVVVGANRPRLYATMLAAQSLGAIPVPLYQDAVAAECIFPLNNAEVRFCMVEDRNRWTSCSKSASSARRFPTSTLTTRAACATTRSPAWPRWTP